MNNNARSFDLTDGWEIGERVYKTIMVMEPNALDILNARLAAEETKVVHYDGGQEIAVVVSPTSAVLELMRRQISQLDGEDIVVIKPMFKGLSARDFQKIQEACDDVASYATAAGGSAEKRGRGDTGGAGG